MAYYIHFLFKTVRRVALTEHPLDAIEAYGIKDRIEVRSAIFFQNKISTVFRQYLKKKITKDFSKNVNYVCNGLSNLFSRLICF